MPISCSNVVTDGPKGCILKSSPQHLFLRATHFHFHSKQSHDSAQSRSQLSPHCSLLWKSHRNFLRHGHRGTVYLSDTTPKKYLCNYGVSIFASGQITRFSCRTGFGKHNYCRTQNSSTEPQQWKRHPGTEEVNTKTVTSKMPYVDFLTDRLETDFGKSSNVPAQEHCSDTSSPGWKRGRQLRRVLPG